MPEKFRPYEEWKTGPDAKFPPEYDPNLENSDISRLYSLMKEQEIKESDVIVWMEGDLDDRASKCIKLLESGYAPKVMLNGGAPNSTTAKEIKDVFLKAGIPESKMIVYNEDVNTKDQAQYALKMARENNWKKMIVVTNPYHQFRVFLTFLTELKNNKQEEEIEIINAPADLNWFRKTPWRGREEVDLLAEEEIPRLIKYGQKGDVAKPSEGIEYLLKWKEKEAKN